jgi:hypothetical protein
VEHCAEGLPVNDFAPDVSVVIPVYNRAALLVRAVSSCLAQPCRVEVIVVDDGSTENLRAALETRFAAALASDRPPRLRIHRQENQGQCVARNLGLSKATGEFTKFLDSDDELLPGVLAEEVRTARQTACDALVTGWEERTFRPDGTEDMSKRRTRPAPDLRNGIDDMLRGQAPCTSSALYRTDFIRNLKWDPAWFLKGDWAYPLTVCLAGARFASLDVPSYAYVQHGGARMTDLGATMLPSTRARQAILGMVERKLREQDALTEPRRRLLAQYYYRDCQVLAEHDPEEWQRVWSHCRDLCPGFRPAESNRIVRLLSAVLGIPAGVPAYVRMKKIYFRLFPRRGPTGS